MSIPLRDLPLSDLNDLLSNLFSKAVKVDGSQYPSASFMNMLNLFNQIVRRASDARAVQGLGNSVERDFNISRHLAFVKACMVLQAAIRKSAKEGINKKRVKLEVLTEEHKKAILADMDHQLSDPQGCQKQLAFFCLVRLRMRGGLELWEFQREDLTIAKDKEGKEYVRFEERTSKNNNYTPDRYNEEQFRKTFHSFEDDFVICVKQYFRHMVPLSECEKHNLFMGPILSPMGNVWYNGSQKVGREKVDAFLRTMVTLVGLPGDLFSNKSGRSSLVTRLAVKGVPDEVGMLVIGHHSISRYQRYDRTQDLKMEVAILAATDPTMNYETALTNVSKKFIQEKVVGSSRDLKPLIQRHLQMLPLALGILESVRDAIAVGRDVKIPGSNVVKIPRSNAVKILGSNAEVAANKMKVDGANPYEALHKIYDEID